MIRSKKQIIVTALNILFLLAVLGFAMEIGATISLSRIGGQNLPPPEFPDGWDVQFESLSWAEVDESGFGTADLVDLSQEFITPVGLDSTQNLTPLLRDRGGTVNDEFVAEFTVVLLDNDETVEMEVFDLSGRLIRRLSQTRGVSSGRYRMTWDGRDEDDHLVLPGIDTMRLSLQADTDGAGIDKSAVLRTVAITY